MPSSLSWPAVSASNWDCRQGGGSSKSCTKNTSATKRLNRTLQGDSTHEVQRLVHLMAKGTAQRSVSELVRDTVDKLYDLYMETDAEAWQQIPQPKPLSSEKLAALIQELRDAALPADSHFADARDKELAAAEVGDWESFIGSGLAAKVLDGETTF